MITLLTSSERHSWAVSTTSSSTAHSVSRSRRNRRASAGRARVAVELEHGAMTVRPEDRAAGGGAGAERVGADPAYGLGGAARGGVEHPPLGLAELLVGVEEQHQPAHRRRRCPGSGSVAIARVPCSRCRATTPGNRASSSSRLPMHRLRRCG